MKKKNGVKGAVNGNSGYAIIKVEKNFFVFFDSSPASHIIKNVSVCD